jgi:2,4-dienoyl-CoA reductase-like NADH-dependent reductase (Old Yellow Enzyme family)/NADH dehydrogenase FAD-containing subunit
MSVNHSVLFKPGCIGKLRLKNRIVKSPQTTALSNQDGTISARTVNHYKRLAEGGVGLILVEYSYVDDDASKSIHAQVGVSRREHIPGLGWLADTAHAAGAKIGVQLVHTGRQKYLGTAPIKSASDVSWDEVERQYGVRPQPMTAREINGVVTSFGDAALRLVLARFDIVEVHAAHGYLITNFLSPHTNRRTDEYGGSFENRARLLLRIVADIRSKIPGDFPLSVRLSVVDYEPDGITIEETVELCRLLEKAGVDAIHASGGHHAKMEYEVGPWFMPYAPHRWGWEKIKAAVAIPVIGSGSLVSPDLAAEIVANGSADFVSLGRAMLADPDWARKTQERRAGDIVPCIRCNDGCLHRGVSSGRSVGCTVNPSLGHEYSFAINKSPRPRNVAVVGGGPAGLKAAMTLADKGHTVALFEPGDLGGRLIEAARSPLKQDLRAFLSFLRQEISRRPIDIIKTTATPDTLKSGSFDHVLVASGMQPRRLPNSGFAPHARMARDLDGHSSIVSPIVIIGGGMVGCDLALRLRLEGHDDVNIVEKNPTILSSDDPFGDQMGLPGKLAETGVKIRFNCRAVGYDGTRIAVIGPNDGKREFEANTVAVAVGHEAERSLYDALEPVLGHRVELIGTARSGRRVFDAIHDGFFAAYRL